MRDDLVKIARDFFCYMAKEYPVMCSSDEFYFFPRARESIEHLDTLDSLEGAKIEENILYVKKIRASLSKIDTKGLGLESRIDMVVLNQGLSTFLREFDRLRIWRRDPLLYLKIVTIGIDQILSRFSFIRSHIDDALHSRLIQIPRLLNEAKGNLDNVPDAYLGVALEAIDAAVNYFRNSTALNSSDKSTILSSIKDFRGFLLRKSSPVDFIRDRSLIEDILKHTYSYNTDLEEIFEIASKEYARALKDLSRIAKGLKHKRSWQQALYDYKIDIDNEEGLIKLYASQIKKLRTFFRNKGVVTIPKTQDIEAAITPEFIRPLRASASYASPITTDRREPAYFYISPNAFDTIHNEYLFVTAHETYPGHHLLDAVRRSLKNPIRQQIESPLFYEGWASYAETLIDEMGYVQDPLQKMVGLRRQGWRAIRAMLDVGIRIKRLSLSDAASLLKDLGYGSNIVKSMIRHYLLLPGYQLCYTIGKYEITRLRKRYASRIGLKKFHDLILRGGQIPFDLVEARIKAYEKNMSSPRKLSSPRNLSPRKRGAGI